MAVKFTHQLTRDVTTASGRLVLAGTKVELRGSRRNEDGQETVLLRLSSTWKSGGEFVTDYTPGLLTRITNPAV